MSANAVLTYASRVKRALGFCSGTYWLGFGRSSTPWPQETAPPSPPPGTTSIDEPFFYVKANRLTPCRPVTQQEFDAAPADRKVAVNGVNYLFVDAADAYDEVARWVHVQGSLDPSAGHPLGTFRTIGIFSGLVPTAGYEQALSLAPNHVQTPGVLEWLDHLPPVTLTGSMKCVQNIVIEFR